MNIRLKMNSIIDSYAGSEFRRDKTINIHERKMIEKHL